MIPALQTISAINDRRSEAVVVSTMTPNRYWQSVSENPDLDFPIFGAMGKASSVALGIALAQPTRKVFVLDGDGGLLMNLGTLVTIGGQQPTNLVHFVFEDGVYFTTGGQPVPGAGMFDLAGLACSAGFKTSLSFNDLEEFVGDLPDILERPGPTFVCLKVEHSDDAPGFVQASGLGSTREAMHRVAQTFGMVLDGGK